MRHMTTARFALMLLFAATAADAAPILELEVNGTATNNTTATAQAIPGSAFTLPVPLTVFNPPGYATATVSGAGGSTDVDFFSFSANGGQVYFDIDNNPFTFDSILSLFDSAGTLIAYDDDSSPVDPGTANALDSFLGVYTLPGAGTYFLAVSTFSNFATAAFSNPQLTNLTRPDGNFGGTAVTGATVGDSSFPSSGVQTGSAYTLHLSVQNPVGAQVVPEPSSLLLFGTGAAGLILTARRRARQRRT